MNRQVVLTTQIDGKEEQELVYLVDPNAYLKLLDGSPSGLTTEDLRKFISVEVMFFEDTFGIFSISIHNIKNVRFTNAEN